MNFIIEAGKTPDVAALGKLYDDVNDYLAANINYCGWKKGIYPTLDDAAAAIGRGMFVAKCGDEIAGTVVLNHEQPAAYAQATWGVDAHDDEVLVINKLATHPVFLGQGVAVKLLEFAEKHAAAIGCKTIRLDVTVQNEPAIKLYEKCGYKYVDTVDLGLPYEGLKWFKLYEIVL